jgi:transcriptional regulator with XRE-family HTH domain
MILQMKRDPRKSFGARVRQLRNSADISQEKLGDLCGLHRTYIGAVERGERNISLLNIVAIARALNVAPAELLVEIKT